MAVLIDNEGSILSDYLKTNMIPVIEDDYKAGDGVIPCDHVTIDGQERYISYSKYIAPIWSFLALLILAYAAVCRLGWVKEKRPH